MLSLFDGEQCHFPMQLWRSRDANQIDVIATNGLAPIVRVMLNAKLLCRCSRVLDAAACDGNDLGALACFKARDLNATRETCADDANAYSICHKNNLHIGSR